MPRCKECRYGRMGLTDPMEGYCIYGLKDTPSDETTSGTATMVVPGKMVNLRNDACENFEKKPSHSEFIKETN